MLTKHKKYAGISKKKIFHHAKMQSSKTPLKQTKILQDIITPELI
jgi:hypothetical protein